MSIDEEFSRSQTRRAKANYNRSPLEFIFTKSQQVGAVISMILYFQYFVYRTERVMDSYLIEHSFLQDLRESVAPSSNETYETQYLVFRPVEEGQGLGNIMNGLLAIQMLGLEFNRTVCVDKDWTGFHQAFHEINYELCDELSSRESIQSSRTLRFLNYNQPPNECDLKAALASNTEVLYIITNTYPRWPEVPPRLWEHHYEPRSELIDAMPYSHRPSVVVHLRHGDDKSDIRAGLDNATFHALGKTLPSNTFLVTNNVIWYNFFESLYGWDHPNWQQISHSALFIDWPSLNQTAAKPTNTSITQDVNIQLFCDWYTILMADKVYHTHSDFSLSAIHWNDIESKTIQGVDPSNKLQLSDESWRLESTMPPLVDRSGNGLAHCDIGPIPSGDDSPEDDFFGGPVVDDQYDANYGKTVNIFRERIRRSNTNRVDDDKLDAFTLPDEENPFRFENLVSYKRTSSITKYNDDQVLGEMSPRFLQREKPPDWVDDIIANSNADDDFNDV